MGGMFEEELEELSQQAGYNRIPKEGDWFVSRSAVEHSALPPDGIRYGSVRRGHMMQAMQVAVVQIPSARGLVSGIAIQVNSSRIPGEMAWVNVCKGRVRFADLAMPPRRGRAAPGPY